MVLEDRYNSHSHEERALVERCVGSAHFVAIPFAWQDEGETFRGTRYVWHTNRIDVAPLFTAIIRSDLGEPYALDGAVFLLDGASGTVVHLYDDRGAVVFGEEARLETLAAAIG